MKKIILALSASLLFAATISAQKKPAFEGVINYAISFENSGLPPQALEMLKGAESTVYIKNDKRRVDVSTAMQSTSSVVDNKTKSILTTMEVMGQKYLIKSTEADLKKEKEAAPQTSIKYIDETKEIAGYKCKKAEVTTKSKDGKEDMFVVYYTEEIPAAETKSTFDGLKGFPLDYTVSQGGIKMTFSTKTIVKEPVPDSKFELSKDGYKETTLEELQKSMMGGQ
jgi:GLPGLI family protein